ALVSFAYNLGARTLSTSTLLRKLNAGDYAGAADEFLRWNKAGSKVLNGLTRRREAERALFLS
ncbi:lysozyme, partial [Salmonella enterica subsp. enterica serovar Weltevreden]